MKLPRILLASTSPRRQELLRQIGVEFDVIAPQVDESALAGETPGDLVQRLALAKAQSVARRQGRGIVLGADTVVVLDGALLGKPSDAGEALVMLRRLGGRSHTVYTGFAIINTASGKIIHSIERAEVTFKPLRDEEIAAYVATGSPLDKAGAYGIQDDLCKAFIENVIGDIHTVIGLPIESVRRALQEIGKNP